MAELERRETELDAEREEVLRQLRALQEDGSDLLDNPEEAPSGPATGAEPQPELSAHAKAASTAAHAATPGANGAAEPPRRLTRRAAGKVTETAEMPPPPPQNPNEPASSPAYSMKNNRSGAAPVPTISLWSGADEEVAAARRAGTLNNNASVDPQRALNELLLDCENEVREAKGYVVEDQEPIRVVRCKARELAPENATYLSRPEGTGVDFTVPVQIKGYNTVIKKPVNLNMIRTRCRSGQYSRYEEYLEDMRLLARNTRKYNTSSEVFWIVQHAELLLEAAEEAVQSRKRLLVDAEEALARYLRKPPVSTKGSGSVQKRKREAGVLQLGMLIETLWKEDEKWYTSRVIQENQETGEYSIQYVDDGFTEWILPSAVKWRPKTKRLATMEDVENLRGEVLGRIDDLKVAVFEELRFCVQRLEQRSSSDAKVKQIELGIATTSQLLRNTIAEQEIEMQALRQKLFADLLATRKRPLSPDLRANRVRAAHPDRAVIPEAKKRQKDKKTTSPRAQPNLREPDDGPTVVKESQQQDNHGDNATATEEPTFEERELQLAEENDKDAEHEESQAAKFSLNQTQASANEEPQPPGTTMDIEEPQPPEAVMHDQETNPPEAAAHRKEAQPLGAAMDIEEPAPQTAVQNKETQPLEAAVHNKEPRPLESAMGIEEAPPEAAVQNKETQPSEAAATNKGHQPFEEVVDNKRNQRQEVTTPDEEPRPSVAVEHDEEIRSPEAAAANNKGHKPLEAAVDIQEAQPMGGLSPEMGIQQQEVTAVIKEAQPQESIVQEKETQPSEKTANDNEPQPSEATATNKALQPQELNKEPEPLEAVEGKKESKPPKEPGRSEVSQPPEEAKCSERPHSLKSAVHNEGSQPLEGAVCSEEPQPLEAAAQPAAAPSS